MFSPVRPTRGKTSLLASAANNGKRIYNLDFDYEKTQGVVERMTDEGKSNFINIPMYAEYDEKNKQPKGMTAFDKCKEVLDDLKSDRILDDKDTILCIDSLTNFANSVNISTLKFTSGGEPDTRRTVMLAWDIATYFLGKVMTYTSNCGLVMMGHTKEIEIEGRPTETGLDFLSKNYSLQIPRFAGMSAIFHVEKTPKKDGPPQVKVMTQMSNKLKYIKCPYSDIPAECDPDNFLINIINRHETGVWKEL